MHYRLKVVRRLIVITDYDRMIGGVIIFALFMYNSCIYLITLIGYVITYIGLL